MKGRNLYEGKEPVVLVRVEWSAHAQARKEKERSTISE
jgi:hypothetical protein